MKWLRNLFKKKEWIEIKLPEIKVKEEKDSEREEE